MLPPRIKLLYMADALVSMTVPNVYFVYRDYVHNGRFCQEVFFARVFRRTHDYGPHTSTGRGADTAAQLPRHNYRGTNTEAQIHRDDSNGE